ncbi:hypothetical protein KY289_007919 [Solanum tuberosum]|nr:hypothetical protein KY289_007919 [Solanum tuberosum]
MHIQLLRSSEDEQQWDKPWWMLKTSGKFTVGSAWDFLREKQEICLKYKYIWSAGVPFKISFFNWRLWKQRLPSGKVLIRNMMGDGVVCGCCDDGVQETIEHLFIRCSFTNSMWRYFAGSTGVEGRFLQLKDTLYKWWNADVSAKLKPVLMAVPLFICWQVWKRRNALKFGGSMSYLSMRGGIANNLILLAKQLYPWMYHLPNNWPELVRYLIGYTPRIGCKVVYWKLPRHNTFKCNTDDSSKGNPGPSSSAFCIRDDQGNLVYAEGNMIGLSNNLIAEVVAIRLGLEYCRIHNLLPLILETDSLAAMKMIEGAWHRPWEVTMEVRRIQILKEGLEVAIVHTLREGNKLVNFMANIVFSFAGTNFIY